MATLGAGGRLKANLRSPQDAREGVDLADVEPAICQPANVS